MVTYRWWRRLVWRTSARWTGTPCPSWMWSPRRGSPLPSFGGTRSSSPPACGTRLGTPVDIWMREWEQSPVSPVCNLFHISQSRQRIRIYSAFRHAVFSLNKYEHWHCQQANSPIFHIIIIFFLKKCCSDTDSPHCNQILITCRSGELTESYHCI